MEEQNFNNITVENLYSTYSISYRAYNCCRSNGLLTLFDIAKYYIENGSFLAFRNIGSKTNEELIALCKDYDVKKVKSIKKPFLDDFSAEQLQILKIKYQSLIEQSSARVKHFFGNVSFEQFVDEYLFCYKNLFFIDNIGKTSVLIIKRTIIDDFLDFSEKVKTFDDIDQQFYPISCLYNFSEQEKDFFISFYKAHGHYPMFNLFEKIILNNTSKKNKINLDAIKVFEHKKTYTTKELSIKYNYTRQSISNIVDINYLLKKIPQTTTIIENLSYIDDIIVSNHLVLTNKQTICKILEEENCSLSEQFVILIIQYLFDKYTVLGNIEILGKSDTDWTYFYLLPTNITEYFDFNKYRKDFESTLKNNKEEYEFNIREYLDLSPYWLKDERNTVIDNCIIEVIKKILLFEFDLCNRLDIPEQFGIPAFKRKSPDDVIYNILLDNGKPMHLTEIIKKFKEIISDRYTKPESVRSLLLRNPNIATIKRTSTYTLKEWNNSRQGTIRKRIIEYLVQCNKPVCSNEILDYVKNYFPETTANSIRTTMINDTLHRFVKFKHGQYGLSSKEYDKSYEIIEKHKCNNLQSIDKIEQFVIHNKRFPFSARSDKEEYALYRFWASVLNGKKELTDSEKEKVEHIKNTYSCFPRTKDEYIWYLECQNSLQFLNDVKKDFQVFVKQKNTHQHKWIKENYILFFEARLNEFQSINFDKICTLLEELNVNIFE